MTSTLKLLTGTLSSILATLLLQELKVLVFDVADQLLEMGFRPAIGKGKKMSKKNTNTKKICVR